MAYEAGTLDATLAAAAGNDPVLIAELRVAFLESLTHQLDLLRRARCDGNWQIAALRLKGLAASFNAESLMVLADQAIDTAPGDPVAVRKIQAFLDAFAAN